MCFILDYQIFLFAELCWRRVSVCIFLLEEYTINLPMFSYTCKYYSDSDIWQSSVDTVIWIWFLPWFKNKDIDNFDMKV